MTENQSKLLDDAFDQWWLNEGSGMAPLSGHDHEAHARRISRIAWHNGAHAALDQISPPGGTVNILTKNTDQLRRVVAEHIAADAVVQGNYWNRK